jgi:hypothetical protein
MEWDTIQGFDSFHEGVKTNEHNLPPGYKPVTRNESAYPTTKNLHESQGKYERARFSSGGANFDDSYPHRMYGGK